MEITAIHVETNDLSGTEDFYSRKMQLPLLSKTERELQLKAGSSLLHFTLTQRDKPIYHFAIDVAHNQLEKAAEWLAERIDLLQIAGSRYAEFNHWNARSVYFYDNNGNIVELIARFDLHNASDWNSSPDYQHISEIGAVTDSVADLCGQINRRTGLDFYELQPPLPNFAALGDTRGLLIVVEEGKSWYPTSVKASPYPLKVNIRAGGKDFLLDLGPGASV